VDHPLAPERTIGERAARRRQNSTAEDCRHHGAHGIAIEDTGTGQPGCHETMAAA
jgi:hypothetical protein